MRNMLTVPTAGRRALHFQNVQMVGIHVDTGASRGLGVGAQNWVVMFALDFPPNHEYCRLERTVKVREAYLRDGKGRRLLAEKSLVCIKRLAPKHAPPSARQCKQGQQGTLTDPDAIVAVAVVQKRPLDSRRDDQEVHKHTPSCLRW